MSTSLSARVLELCSASDCSVEISQVRRMTLMRVKWLRAHVGGPAVALLDKRRTRLLMSAAIT